MDGKITMELDVPAASIILSIVLYGVFKGPALEL